MFGEIKRNKKPVFIMLFFSLQVVKVAYLSEFKLAMRDSNLEKSDEQLQFSSVKVMRYSFWFLLLTQRQVQTFVCN